MEIDEGPEIGRWAPEISDEVAAWWAARRRWRDAVDAYAERSGEEAWQVMNRCRTRRPHRAV